MDLNNIDVNFFLADALFTKDKNGNIRFWKISDRNDCYHTYSGVLGRYKALSDFKENVTPVYHNNRRSIKDQVDYEVAAKAKQRINDGFKFLTDLGLEYVPDEDVYIDGKDIKYDDIYDYVNEFLELFKRDNKGFLKPMLAKKFKYDMVRYPAYIQPKINGIRALIRWGEVEEGEGIFKKVIERPIITSREGKIYHLPHLYEKLRKDLFYYKGEEIVYDGELYIHNTSLNIIRSAVPMLLDSGTLSNASGPVDKIQYWAFDIAILRPQSERIHILNNKFYNYSFIGDSLDHIKDYPLIKVPTSVVMNDTDAKMKAEYYISRGFEGAIVRDSVELYGFGIRGKRMVKIKRHYETECLIIDVIPKPKEPETGMFVLKNDINSERFECNPEGTFEERANYLENKFEYIGKKATVKYCERSGVKKVPFHANVITVRDYE